MTAGIWFWIFFVISLVFGGVVESYTIPSDAG